MASPGLLWELGKRKTLGVGSCRCPDRSHLSLRGEDDCTAITRCAEILGVRLSVGSAAAAGISGRIRDRARLAFSPERRPWECAEGIRARPEGEPDVLSGA